MIETQLQIKKVSLGKGITVLCKTIGTGRPMVLIHGWGYPWAITKEFVAPLKERYKLYFINLPGYEGSDISKLHGEVGEYTEVLTKLLEKLQLEKSAILIGHSLGAVVLLKYLEHATGYIHPTLLFGLPLGEKMPVWAELLLPLRFHDSLLRSRIISKRIADFISQETQKIADKKILIREYHGSVKPSILGYNIISAIQARPEVIYSKLEHKPILVYGERERFRKYCDAQGIAYETIADCGHSPMLEKPREAAQIIKKYIEGLSV